MLAEPTPSGNEISLREYLNLLRRRKMVVLQTFVAVLVIGIVVTLATKPLFRSETAILVENKAPTVAQVDTSNPMGSALLPGQGHSVSTQLEVLQSDNVLIAAFKDAGVPMDMVNVKAEQVADTEVIKITAESNNPRFAEKVARQLPTSYKDYILTSTNGDVQNAANFTTKQLDKEQTALDEAEKALQRFNKARHITDLDTERTASINAYQAAQADVDREKAVIDGIQARLDELLGKQASLATTTATPVETTNPQIEIQKNNIALLEAQRTGMMANFGPKHPRMIELDANIAKLKENLKSLAPTVTVTSTAPNPLKTQYDDKITETRAQRVQEQAQLKQVHARAAKASAQLDKYGQMGSKLKQLLDDVDLHRSRYMGLQKSSSDLEMRLEASPIPLRVITPAGAAEQVRPKKLNNLLFSVVIGLLLGFCFALLQEFIDDRINSPDEARRLLGTPVLGYVPLIETEGTRLLNQAKGHGYLLESYRVMRSNVQFANVDTALQTIQVTSTTPGEGKSLTAANLAVAMALDGKRVILVDCDLRRPTVHSKFGVDQRPGLTNVLVGHSTLEDALQSTSVTGLSLLTSGPLPPNPAELLNSRAMTQLLESLKETADTVILDSPPCLAAADAQVLSAKVDGVLFVIQFGDVKKSAVRHAVDMLRQAHAQILGVVFNKIELTENRDDYFYNSYRYYNYYSHGTTAPQIPGNHKGRHRSRRSTDEFEALVTQNNGNGASKEGSIASKEAAEPKEKS